MTEKEFVIFNDNWFKALTCCVNYHHHTSSCTYLPHGFAPDGCALALAFKLSQGLLILGWLLICRCIVVIIIVVILALNHYLFRSQSSKKAIRDHQKNGVDAETIISNL